MDKVTGEMTSKEKLEWYNSLPLEEQLYKTIEANHLLEGDTVDNHPSKLDDEAKVTIWEYNYGFSIVRSNILELGGYVPYCNCPGLTRFKSNGVGKQMSCKKCGITTKFSQSFLNEWTKKAKENGDN